MKIVVIGLTGESIFLNVDHFNRAEETISSSTLIREPGGKGYNQALTLGKLNNDISFITTIGNDIYKEECKKVLEENNIKGFYIEKDVESSLAVIITDKNGDNRVTVYKGASDKVTYDDIMKYRNIIDEADYLLIQLEYPYDVTKQIIDYAFNKNIKIILNPAPALELSKDILKKIFIIIPNEDEIMRVINGNTIDDNLLELSKYCKYVICTRGSKDIIYIENKEIKSMNSLKVEAVDTTGAGDIFCGCLVNYIAKGFDLSEAIKRAIIGSAISVTRRGVVQAICSEEEIENYINGER